MINIKENCFVLDSNTRNYLTVSKNSVCVCVCVFLNLLLYARKKIGGARGVMVIVVGNGHGDSSSNPGRDRLHFT